MSWDAITIYSVPREKREIRLGYHLPEAPKTLDVLSMEKIVETVIDKMTRSRGKSKLVLAIINLLDTKTWMPQRIKHKLVQAMIKIILLNSKISGVRGKKKIGTSKTNSFKTVIIAKLVFSAKLLGILGVFSLTFGFMKILEGGLLERSLSLSRVFMVMKDFNQIKNAMSIAY